MKLLKQMKSRGNRGTPRSICGTNNVREPVVHIVSSFWDTGNLSADQPQGSQDQALSCKAENKAAAVCGRRDGMNIIK